jgi:hypothetical protein
MALRARTPSWLVVAALICLGLALVSLLMPSGPGYDQYAWLVWGRDLAHLDLSTRGGGTSWKPLPPLVDAVLSPLGAGAADGWVVVARAGALFAVVLAFRLAWRLAPRGRVLAGTVAALTLVLTNEWVRRTGVGNAEALAVPFGLLAVDRHLDGRRGQAFALIVAAGLIRVEAWPFALAYGAWLCWRSRSRRVLAAIAAGLLTLPLLWFGGDWVGSGSPATGTHRALRPIPGTPGTAPHPARAVLTEAAGMLPWPAWAALAVATGAAAMRRDTRSNDATVLMLAACAAIWTAIVAIMAERGYAGVPRFLFMASAIEAVLAGVGVGLLVSRRSALALVLVVFVIGSVPAAARLPAAVAGIDKVADMDARLALTVREAGGAAAIMRCGEPVTHWYAVTALAWDLDVSAAQIRNARWSSLLEACSRRFVPAQPT